MKILDANMILRFLIRDNVEMAETVKNILKTKKVLVLPEVIAEVIYVMIRVYNYDKAAVTAGLLRFLNLNAVTVEHMDVLKKGIETFCDNNLDFVDCLLYAYHTEKDCEICTFDKKLIKLLNE